MRRARLDGSPGATGRVAMLATALGLRVWWQAGDACFDGDPVVIGWVLWAGAARHGRA